MENHNTIAADCEFELPEEIIHQIQSLMAETQAARTTLLSKSWYNAWSSSPNLSFNQRDFRNRTNEFPRFTRKTMQRYEDLNLKIKTFRLWMMKDGYSLAKELILKAIKLGVIDLKIEFQTSDDSIESTVLPHEVLESKTLARLYVSGLTIDLQNRNKVVSCSNLKSLTLFNTSVNGDLFRVLVSKCPLIEELKWDQYHPPKIFNPPMRRLEEFDDEIVLHKLKYLRLNGLDVQDALYGRDLCPKFPCLKELVIWNYCNGDVRICSPSLERITIRIRSSKLHHGMWDGEFDVPNIRNFKMSIDHHVPRLEFRTSSREWESDIDINYSLDKPFGWWFSSLNQLVKMLSLSRISLSLNVDIKERSYSSVYFGDGLPIPAVEKLTLCDWNLNVTTHFMDSLFRSCRPNFVKIEKHCAFGVEKMKLEEFLKSQPWKILLDDSRTFSSKEEKSLKIERNDVGNQSQVLKESKGREAQPPQEPSRGWAERLKMVFTWF